MMKALFVAAILSSSVASAGSYTITLTPQQDAMLATVSAWNGATPQQYLASTVAARLQTDYGAAMKPLAGQLVDQWNVINKGQKTSLCQIINMQPCPP